MWLEKLFSTDVYTQCSIISVNQPWPMRYDGHVTKAARFLWSTRYGNLRPDQCQWDCGLYCISELLRALKNGVLKCTFVQYMAVPWFNQLGVKGQNVIYYNYMDHSPWISTNSNLLPTVFNFFVYWTGDLTWLVPGFWVRLGWCKSFRQASAAWPKCIHFPLMHRL